VFFRNFFFGREATGRGNKRNRNQNKGRKARRNAFHTRLRKDLRLEPLEPRQLLAVNITDDGFGNIVFTDNANVADDLTVDYDGSNYTVTQGNGANVFTDSTTAAVTVTLGGGTTATFPGAQVTSLQIASAGGADQIKIHANAHPVSVNAGSESDPINVGSAANSLAGIAANVTINGGTGGADALNVNDQGSGTGRTYTVTSGSVAWGTGVSVFYDSAVESLIVNASTAADIINVQSSQLPTPVTVNAGNGSDVVNVGFSNSLDNILGAVTVNGGDAGSTDVLNINDQGDTDTTQYDVTSTTVQRSSAATVTYGTMESLVVNAANNATNTITHYIWSTAGGTPTTINLQSGVDDVYVDSNGSGGGGTVNGIASLLTINGNGASDSVTLNDMSDTLANTVTIDGTTSQVGQGATDNFFGTNGKLAYTNIATMNVNMGNTAGDIVNITPVAGMTFNLDGNNPTTHSPPVTPGDILNYTGSGTKTVTGAGSGTLTGTGTVNFQEFELVVPTGSFADVVNLPADGAPTEVTVKLDSTQTYLEIWVENNTAAPPDAVLVSRQEFAKVSGLTINGTSDAETLKIDNGNGYVAHTGFITTFHGSTGTDTLLLTGNPGTPVLRETYLVGNTQDAGRWVLDVDDSAGFGAPSANFNGDEVVVDFDGLDPANTDVVATNFDVIMNAGVNDATIADGVLAAPGFTVPNMQIIDNNSSFETTHFANKTSVTVNGRDGADVFQLNYSTLAAGLATLDVYGNQASGAADDNARDTFSIQSTAALPAGAAVNLRGQGGNDWFENVMTAPLANMDNVNGPVDIDGGAGTQDWIAVQDSASGAAVADSVTLTSTALTGAAPAAITYANVEQFIYEASPLDDTIDITSTHANVTGGYFITGDGGSDTVTIGNTAAGFATPGSGTLANIAGPLVIIPDFNASQGANDILNVDASADAALAGNASISNLGSTNYSWYNGLTATAPVTRLANFAGVNIDYVHGDVTSFGGRSSRLERLNVLGSTGPDTIAVNDTTATVQTTVDAYTGDDANTMTINGDNLSAANVFAGNTGEDRFVLKVTNDLGAAAVYPLTSVQIQGDDPAAVLPGDRLIIDADEGTTEARTLGFDYTAAGPDGGMTVTGFAVNVDVLTMEQVEYQGDAADDDSVTVTASTVDDTVLVDPTGPDSANIHVNGSLPVPMGVADGEPGPDLSLSSGISSLLVDGDTQTTALPGDTLITDLSGITGAVLELIPTKIGFVGAWNFGAGLLGYSFMNFETIDVTSDGTGGPYDVHVRADLSTDAVLNAAPFFLGTNVDMANDLVADRTRVEVVGTDLRITTSDGVNSPTIDLQQMSTDINSFALTGSGDADTLHIIDSGSGLPTFSGTAIGAHSNLSYQNETYGPLSGFTAARVSINYVGGGGTDDLEVDFAGNAAVDVGYYTDEATTASPSGAASNSGVVNVAGGAAGDFRLSFEGLSPASFKNGSGGGNLIVDASASPTTGNLVVDDDVNAPLPLAKVPALNNGVSAVFGDGTFETIQFTGYNTVTIRGGVGSETIDLVSIDTGVDLINGYDGSVITDIVLDGDDTWNTDASDDALVLRSLPAGVTATLLGGADGAGTVQAGGVVIGGDSFVLADLPGFTALGTPVPGTLSLDAILGRVVVSPTLSPITGEAEEGGLDTLYVVDVADPNGDTFTITNSTIDGDITPNATVPDISYNSNTGGSNLNPAGIDVVDTVNILTSDLALDTINIQSTAEWSTYFIDTGIAGAFDDVVNISSDAGANAGILDGIDGQVNVTFGSGAALASATELHVSDFGDTAGDVYDLVAAGPGGLTELFFTDGAAAGGVRAIASTLIGASTADIRYNVNFGTANPVLSGFAASRYTAPVNPLAKFELIGANDLAALNSYNIYNTTGTARNTISDGDATVTGSGNDGAFSIQADAVQPGAINTFNGFDGNDTFQVHFAADAGVPVTAGTTFQINGGEVAADTDNRDVVRLNVGSLIASPGAGLAPAVTVNADTQPRTLGITYAAAGSGDVDITGLGTDPAAPNNGVLDINTVETLFYNGTGPADPTAVTGTAADDDLTVAPLSPDEALVFRGGNPWDGPSDAETFANALPGIAEGDGSTGPDMRLDGMASLTMNGGGVGADGNQLYVYATSEPT